MGTPGRSLSILVHGDAKTGKSTFASTSPKPLLFLDCEGGTKFLNIKPVTWDPYKNAPPVADAAWDTCIVRIMQYDDILKVLEWLKSGKHPFESVVVDSISELQQKLVDKITNRDQAKLQDWGDILRNFIGLMRDFRDLTEHPRKPLQSAVLVAMSVSTDSKKQPFAQGQSKTMLPYLFDVLAATHVDTWTDDTGSPQLVYRLMVGPNPVYATGERVGGRLPAYIDNPTVPGLLDYVFGPETVAATAAPTE